MIKWKINTLFHSLSDLHPCSLSISASSPATATSHRRRRLQRRRPLTASSSNTADGKTLIENSDAISEVLDGSLWTVAAVIGHSSSDDRQNQMQDGLIELVIAYQVIHRLRDLFALYDRPQVEGSPFPSSILLSISLLVILSSRFGVVTSIDWESYMPENETHESESKLLQDVPEDRLLDDLCKREEKNTVMDEV
ncbi:hypothetical protein LXL04_009453 [Taraxacum kok-saghyz]